MSTHPILALPSNVEPRDVEIKPLLPLVPSRLLSSLSSPEHHHNHDTSSRQRRHLGGAHPRLRPRISQQPSHQRDKMALAKVGHEGPSFRSQHRKPHSTDMGRSDGSCHASQIRHRLARRSCALHGRQSSSATTPSGPSSSSAFCRPSQASLPELLSPPTPLPSAASTSVPT